PCRTHSARPYLGQDIWPIWTTQKATTPYLPDFSSGMPRLPIERERVVMTNILVLYYSSYGHIEQMAYAQAEGSARVPGVKVVVKRVPELVPPDVAQAAGFRLDQPA